jgi:hypothetical protein
VFAAVFQGIVRKRRRGIPGDFEVQVDLDQHQFISRDVAEIGRQSFEDGEHLGFIQCVIEAAKRRLIEKKLPRGNQVSVDVIGELMNLFPRGGLIFFGSFAGVVFAAFFGAFRGFADLDFGAPGAAAPSPRIQPSIAAVSFSSGLKRGRNASMISSLASASRIQRATV